MAPRIDSAEVVSFRLKVPRLELDRMCQSAVGQELALELVEDDGGQLHFGPAHGDSFARFRPTGAEALLTELSLQRDENGEFLLRVLGPLMVRFAGDLVLRLTWNVPERNRNAELTEVQIARGMTDYPGIGHVPTTEEEARAAAGAAAGSAQGQAEAGGSPRNELRAGGEELGEAMPSEEVEEIQRLLDKGRAQFEEYLRLKRQRGS